MKKNFLCIFKRRFSSTKSRPWDAQEKSSFWDDQSANYEEGFFGFFAEKYIPDLISKSEIVSNNKKEISLIDIGTGTGALPSYLIQLYNEKHIQKDLRILATDYSSKMISICREKVKSKGNVILSVDQMDGQNLSIPNNSFDYTFSNFALMFFPDHQKGANEMHRILTTNGRTVFSTWDSLSNNPAITAIYKSLDEVRGKVEPGYSFLNSENTNKVFALSNTSYVKQVMLKSGFQDVQVFTIQKNFSGSFEELANLISKNFPVKQEKKKIFWERLSVNFESLLKNQNVHTSAHIVVGTK